MNTQLILFDRNLTGNRIAKAANVTMGDFRVEAFNAIRLYDLVVFVDVGGRTNLLKNRYGEGR